MDKTAEVIIIGAGVIGTSIAYHLAKMGCTFVNRLYDYQNPDEERRPWNDPKIVDPRIGESYDWNRPPHK